MGTPVRKQVKILEAKYVPEADSIIILGECEEGQLRHQINSSCFSFGNKDRKEEMTKTAALMLDKKIWMVFDTDLDGKIKSNMALKY